RAGSEGRNLQFCNVLVNYDLPWNPMVVEQRIGRLHRIGQTREVHIVNLAAAGTIESYILQLLDQKIKLFELVVGELDLILGEFGGAQEFEGRLAKEWLAAESEEDFARRVETMGVEIEKSSAAGKEQEELNSLIAPDDNAMRLERRFETLSVRGRLRLGLGTSQVVKTTRWETKRHRLGVHVTELLEALESIEPIGGVTTEQQPAGTHPVNGHAEIADADPLAEARIRPLLERYCVLAGVKQTALGPDHSKLSLPQAERPFFKDREGLSVAFSLDALERDPDAEIAVLGSPFLSQLIEAIRTRAARLSLGLLAPASASSPLSRRERGTGGEDGRERGDDGVELPIPVRDGTVQSSKAKLAVHPVGRLVARVVLRAGAGVEEAVVESDVYDLAAGARLSDDLAGAGRASPHRGDQAQPGEGRRASGAADRRDRPDAARRVAARVRARAPRAVQRPAVPQWWVGLGARVSALRSFAHGPGDLPARPLRLRGVLVPMLGLRRGLLRRPRYRTVSRGRATGLRRARACLSFVPLAALHGPRRE